MSGQKNVLHLTLYLDIGGLERMVWILCQGQRAEGWCPSVVVYEKDTADLLPQFERDGIRVTFLKKGRGFSPRLPFRILATMRSGDITLIHSHDLGALIYATLASVLSFGRVRVVHTQHSFQHLHGFRMRLYEHIFPWLAKRLVCVSEDLRRTYLSLGQPLRRLRVVPNGVVFREDSVSSDEKEAARLTLLAAHGLPPVLAEKKWVVTLGRLAPVKGAHHVLKVWNALPETDAILLCVGPESDQGYSAELRSTARGDVFFPGPTSDPGAWLAAADLFMSGSEFEGMPLAGLEAVAAGLPMLLSEIPGHGLFRDWAAFFSLTDPAHGTKLLAAFLLGGTLGEGTLDENARKRIERASGAKRMTKRYLEIYEELEAGPT